MFSAARGSTSCSWRKLMQLTEEKAAIGNSAALFILQAMPVSTQSFYLSLPKMDFWHFQLKNTDKYIHNALSQISAWWRFTEGLFFKINLFHFSHLRFLRFHLPACPTPVFFIVFSFGSSSFYCHLLQMCSCKVSAGRTQQNTQSWKDSLGK